MNKKKKMDIECGGAYFSVDDLIMSLVEQLNTNQAHEFVVELERQYASGKLFNSLHGYFISEEYLLEMEYGTDG